MSIYVWYIARSNSHCQPWVLQRSQVSCCTKLLPIRSSLSLSLQYWCAATYKIILHFPLILHRGMMALLGGLRFNPTYLYASLGTIELVVDIRVSAKHKRMSFAHGLHVALSASLRVWFQEVKHNWCTFLWMFNTSVQLRWKFVHAWGVTVVRVFSSCYRIKMSINNRWEVNLCMCIS